MIGLLLTALLTAAPLELHAIPLDVSRAVCFVAAADNDGTADLFVLDGRLLAIYEDAAAVKPRVVELPEDAAALDIADLEDDGQFEAIVIAGDAVYRVDLSGTATQGPVALFQRETQFSAFANTPKLHVLVTAWEGETCLALPTENALELCRPDGTVLAALPMGIDAPHSALYGQPFRYVPVEPPLAGSAGSLEFRVNRLLAFKPQLPDGLAGAEAPGAPPHNTLRRARDAEQLPPGRWPWFPLQANAEQGDRVAYALSAGPPQETWTRLRGQSTLADTDDAEGAFGPLRRYPGSMVVLQADPPDFNGDGYHDLLLWNAPNPTPSISALSRVTVRATWPITVTVHRFIPDKQRFEPKPWTGITIETPIAWFLAGGNQIPVRHLVWRDLNGDGKADFACATASQTYAAWLTGDEGLSARPSFETPFPEDILGIAFEAALEGQRATSIGLRGATRLFVLKPNKAATTPGSTASIAPAAASPAATVSKPIAGDLVLDPSL
jgi:hypothetical protein